MKSIHTKWIQRSFWSLSSFPACQMPACSSSENRRKRSHHSRDHWVQPACCLCAIPVVWRRRPWALTSRCPAACLQSQGEAVITAQTSTAIRPISAQGVGHGSTDALVPGAQWNTCHAVQSCNDCGNQLWGLASQPVVNDASGQHRYFDQFKRLRSWSSGISQGS